MSTPISASPLAGVLSPQTLASLSVSPASEGSCAEQQLQTPNGQQPRQQQQRQQPAQNEEPVDDPHNLSYTARLKLEEENERARPETSKSISTAGGCCAGTGSSINSSGISGGSGEVKSEVSVEEWLIRLGIPDAASKTYAAALEEDGFETVMLLSELDEEVRFVLRVSEERIVGGVI